jgi:hypothetical protein
MCCGGKPAPTAAAWCATAMVSSWQMDMGPHPLNVSTIVLCCLESTLLQLLCCEQDGGLCSRKQIWMELLTRQE